MPKKRKPDLPVPTEEYTQADKLSQYRAICEEHEWTGSWYQLSEPLDEAIWAEFMSFMEQEYNAHLEARHKE